MMKGWALLAAMLVGASLPLHAQQGDANNPAQACSGSESSDRTLCREEEA
ncbi:MAG: hypothetical protein JWQ94_1550, partial [Tardiphaga sp.]|nr:hypothetical protein [Tardiphaga sp.]